MEWFLKRLCLGLLLGAVLAESGFAQQALTSSVRDTIEFSYQQGVASLFDFLNAQADYRSVEINYLNLIGSYLNAANQLNLAVGREVIP